MPDGVAGGAQTSTPRPMPIRWLFRSPWAALAAVEAPARPLANQGVPTPVSSDRHQIIACSGSQFDTSDSVLSSHFYASVRVSVFDRFMLMEHLIMTEIFMSAVLAALNESAEVKESDWNSIEAVLRGSHD